MDTEAISRQARAAVNALTAQLQALENQQTALLQSLQITTSTLSSLPNYNAIAPTLEQIPAYEAKLAMLKHTMNQQALEVAALKRRAEEARQKKLRNSDRVKRLREREREMDRTFLKAKMASSPPSISRPITPTIRAGAGARKMIPIRPSTDEVSGSKDSSYFQLDPGVSIFTQSESGNTTTVTSETPTETIKTVKRKKKARQVEMD